MKDLFYLALALLVLLFIFDPQSVGEGVNTFLSAVEGGE